MSTPARQRLRTGLLSAAAVMAVIVGVLLLSPLRDAVTGGSPTSVVTPSPSPSPSSDGSSVHATAEEKEIVAAVLSSSPVIEQLVGKQDWKITRWAPAVAPEGEQRLIVGAEVTWPEPVSVDMDWPGAYFDPTGQANPPYYAYTKHAKGENLTSVLLLVDVVRSRIVTIWPGPEDVDAHVTVTCSPDVKNPFPVPPID